MKIIVEVDDKTGAAYVKAPVDMAPGEAYEILVMAVRAVEGAVEQASAPVHTGFAFAMPAARD